MEIAYDPEAIEDIAFWKQSGNKGIMNRISVLLENMQQMPFEGIGKPEGLKYNLAGKWSRRITEEHRIVYSVKENIIQVHSLRGHYSE